MKRIAFISVLWMAIFAAMAFRPQAPTIVGKWAFSYLSVKEGVTLTASQKEDMEFEEASLRESKLLIEFFPDGRLKEIDAGYESNTKYRIEAGGKKLVLDTDDGPRTATIVTLTANELALNFFDPEINQMVFHFKRKQ